MNTITIFALCSILSYTISSLIDKKLATIPGQGTRFSAALYKLPVTSLIFSPFIFLSWRATIVNSDFLIAAVLLGSLLALSFELYFRGLSIGQASVLFPLILSANVVLISIIAAPLFKETFSFLRIFGILGVIGGNILLVRSVMEDKWGSLSSIWTHAKKSGLVYFVGLVILAPSEPLLTKFFSFTIEEGFALTGWTYIFAVLTLILLNCQNLARGITEYLSIWKLFLKSWYLLVFGAFTGLLGKWFLYVALLKGGDASYVFPLIEGGELPILTIAAVIIFREKMPWQKGVAIVVLFLSVTAIAFSLN